MTELKEYTPREEMEELTEEQRDLVDQALDKLNKLAQRQQGGRRTIGYKYYVEEGGERYYFFGMGATESFGFTHGLIMAGGAERSFIFSFSRIGKERSIQSKAGDFRFTPYGEVYGKEEPQLTPLPTEEFRKAISVIEEEIKNPKGYSLKEVFPE